MSQDLQEYQEIIEQLKPMINEPEFNQVLSQVAANISRQKRFLIKMELKRLARPCVRLIDLRGQVAGDCREYEHDGRIHFLDDVAVDVFERQLRLFGSYTIGVYEAVKNTENNFRVMHRKQQENQLSAKRKTTEESSSDVEQANSDNTRKHLAPMIRFGNYAKREEERMNFAINIEVFTELNKSIQASTVDVSVSGLKVKVHKEHMFKPGERLVVQFRGLEGEYMLDKKNGISYSIVHIDRSKKEQRLHLKRMYDAVTPSFDAFLERFIHGNKRRYKVDMDNTLDAIHNKSYEQYYTPNFVSAPVYIECIDGHYQPKYMLANDCNREITYYWSDEQQELKLGYLLSHERIAQLVNQPKEQQETILYAFNHMKDERVYFYSASVQELHDNPNLKSVFLGYGARKASWRVYKLQLTEVDLSQAHMPLSLPNSVSDAVKRQNQPPAPRLLARIKNVQHIALLTDITSELATRSYEKIPIRREEVGNLRLFGHPRNRPPPDISVFRYKYHNQRKETRFQLRSKVTVKVDDLVLEGASEDISVRGLKVELHSFFHEIEDTLVNLTFPNLQRVTDKYDLKELPYRVRGISNERNILHLQAINDEQNSTAQRFFDELIRNNRSRLKAYKEEEEIPGIGAALRNLYVHNVINVGFFIKKDGVEYIPDAISSAGNATRLMNLLAYDSEPKQGNLGFLYTSNGVELDFIQYTLKKLKANKSPVMREVFIAFDPSKANRKEAIVSSFADQFKSDTERLEFINQAMGSGQFIAMKVVLIRTGRPDLERIQSELNYVGVYAIHRAKVIEEQLWNIHGMGELIDVTDEVLLRYQFNQQHIVANQRPPAPHKVKSTKIAQLLKA